ncbi:MAG: hypothetical protein HC779_07750 [Phyllobacteriaceae bacterium]|nr:hypothetical protein [Phyllobacteriaceae bacterium]
MRTRAHIPETSRRLADLPAEGMAVFARVRSARPPKPARLFWQDGAAHICLEDGEDGVSPGQACVLYSTPGNDARVYGGGFIKAAYRDAASDALISRTLAAARQAATPVDA